jgi:hypothetical protein
VFRYLLPVDWIGIVFVALGLDWLLTLVLRADMPPPKSPSVRPPPQLTSF